MEIEIKLKIGNNFNKTIVGAIEDEESQIMLFLEKSHTILIDSYYDRNKGLQLDGEQMMAVCNHFMKINNIDAERRWGEIR